MPRFNNRLFKRRKCVNTLLNPSPEANENAAVTDNLTAANSTQTSSSRIKLSQQENKYAEFIDVSKEERNEIINISIFSDALGEAVCCSTCKKKAISLKCKQKIQGLATELVISCSFCKMEKKFLNTRHNVIDCNGRQTKVYEINTRLTYAMRAIGKGEAAAKMLCGIMNVPAPVQRFLEGRETLFETIESVAKGSMIKAAEEALLENGNISVPVALDGTWQRRGHTSLNGVITATSVDTGKVLDVEVLSKFCSCSNKCNHSISCTANYAGNSGGMEVCGAKAIFSRSLAFNGLKYTKFLGDGDSKAFKAVKELQPYGANTNISKLECVGHVEKRMGTRLRNLKNKMKKQKLYDGKPLGGKGRLTDSVIDKIQLYYGLAIRKNVNSLAHMKHAVWAIFFHKLSDDRNPHHGLCPSDKDTWCGYKKAEITQTSYHHKNNLPPAVMDCIKPIFRDLADPVLLKKCLHGKTQNCNESLNNVIWSRIPKTTFVQLGTLQMGVNDAISTYNEGNVIRCRVLAGVNIIPGFYMCRAMLEADCVRVRKADYAVRQCTKAARIKKRQQKIKYEEQVADSTDDPAYGAGMH